MQPAGRGGRPTDMHTADPTHPRTAARPSAHAAAVLASVLALVSGLAAAGARLSCVMHNLLIPCVEELEAGDGAAWGGLSSRHASPSGKSDDDL